MDHPNTKSDSAKQPEREDRIDETDLAADSMGNNQLHGDDQGNVHNQRQAQAEVRGEADADPVESFRKLDKDVRAREELGKGNRSGSQEDGE